MADNRTIANIRADEYNTEDKFGTRLLSEGYNVGSHSYPDGLGVRADLQHYVTFFINVRGKSKFVQNGSYKINDTVNPSAIAGTSIRNTLDNSDLGTSAVFGGAVGFGAGIIAKGVTGALLGEATGTGKAAKAAAAATSTAGRSPIGRIGGVVAKGLLGIGLATLAGQAAAATQVLEKDKTKRLQNVITLHMQERPSVSYGINYQDKDLGILGGLLGLDSSISESFL